MGCVGILSALANLLLVYAYTLDKISRINSLFFILVLLGYLEDIYFLGGQLDVLDCIGTLLIILSSFVIFILKYRDD